MSYFENIRIHDGDDILEVETDGSINARINDGSGNALTSTENTDKTVDLDGVRGLNTNAMLFARVDDDTVKNIRADQSTEALITIDYAHHDLHEGSMYHVHTSAAGGSGTKATISFTTPDTTQYFHLVFFYRSNVESLFTMGEGATVTAVSGADYLARNRNRNDADTSTCISAGSAGGATYVTTGGTVTNFGATVDQDHFGSGQKTGGAERASNEWVLKRATTYAFEVESQAASSEVGLALTWYQHSDRN